ncbi:YeeE/YedE thiosulfate transporter family protein [Tamlana sp. 2_MG-2023]|uniref:YeeE/YedE family protein n=1 Tax=unclassified Tamlana TaxID=2614803 RepID=UPI0026E4945F|nr:MULTISPECIES: YeeE/YedE thiosulfate transporter family protein [unclassified Tamlana]MDO6760015.1 YeeE/YedE thiosulfate transporter family protein [Tamlana sp. 2_MG-2023]MDO6790287.1 YeeE/YedE thiosulfate transporter family protein [Tamlana sp. 1_MG-2023]
MEHILNPWPWYISGPLIAIVMALLLYFGKTFGMSSNLRTLCAIGGAGKFADFFKFNWKDQLWNLTVVLGTIIGGFIAVHFLSNDSGTILNPTTISELQNMGFENPGATLVPDEMFSFEAISSAKGLILLILGGLLVGFGTRYAGGCTSGHAITGLSSLQKPSLIAVIGFFIGGLIMANFILPLIF